MEQRWLTTGEAAREYGGCCRQTVFRWAKEGRVPAVRSVTGRVLIREEDAQRLLAPLGAEKAGDKHG